MGFAATVAGPEASTQADAAARRTGAPAPDLPLDVERGVGNQAMLRRRAWATPPVDPVSRRTAETVLQRDVDDDEIEKIESEKLEIDALLKRCEGLDPGQRDRMIAKVGAHASTTHEERQMACLLATKYKGKMLRADFYNTFHELLERLDKGQPDAVLDYVGPASQGNTVVTEQGVASTHAKQSINDTGMKGAPGSSIRVDGVLYVFVDAGVQFKFTDLDKGGPAGRNNNPGNITVNDAHPQAWDPDIGAYRGRWTDDHQFAVFPTLQKGKDGAKAWAARHPESTLLGYFKIYAPPGDGKNKPEDYADTVAAHVTSKVQALTGKPAGRDTTIAQVVAAKAMSEFIEGQIEAEGFTQANVKLLPVTDPTLPKAVRDFASGFAAAADNAEADKVAKASVDEAAAKKTATPTP